MATVTTLMVPGMTCGHCVSAVTNELEAVAGVENVSVELRKGEESEVTVFSDAALDEAALREAIDEAGYDVTSISTDTQALATESAEQAAKAEQAEQSAQPTGAFQDLGLVAADAPGKSGGCGCGNCNCQ